MFENIPAELVRRKQWLVWKIVIRDGSSTKMPFQINGKPAKSSDPSTWTTFAEAVAFLDDHPEYEGLGFVFTADDPYIGIDFDGCRDPDTGEWESWAKDWITKLDSYAEMSPSETGAKVWVKGEPIFATGKNLSLPNEPKVSEKDPGIEVYDHGRFFCMTGRTLAATPKAINNATTALAEMKSHFWPAPTLPPVTNVLPNSSSLVDRARAYISKMDIAVQGQSGSNKCFHVACVLVCSFGLNEAEAMMLLTEYSAACEPPWSPKELAHKIKSASQQPKDLRLRDAPLQKQSSIQLPQYDQDRRPPTPQDIPCTTLRESYVEFLDRLKNPSVAKLVSTGIADLDWCLNGGIDFGELVIFCGRPSHGKSAVGLQLIHEATAAGLPCVIINEETTTSAIGQRVARYASSIPEKEWSNNIANLANDGESHFQNRQPCYIRSNCRTVGTAIELIEHHVKHDGVKIAVIDYAQLLRGAGKTSYEQVGHMSREFKSICKRLNIIVVLLAQLNREIESRSKFIPKASDLRETGQLEQDADTIVGLVYPKMIDPNAADDAFQVFVMKNKERGIRQTELQCKFNPNRQSFSSASRPDIQIDFGTQNWGGEI